MACKKCSNELTTSGVCNSCGWQEIIEPEKSDSSVLETDSDTSQVSEELRQEDSAENEPQDTETMEQEDEDGEPTEMESDPQVSSLRGEVDLSRSTVNNQGDLIPIGVLNATINYLRQDELEQKVDSERSLSEVTQILPPRNVTLSDWLVNQLDSNLQQLKERRLILISCYNQKYALEAAYALIESLNLPSREQKQTLYFESPAWGNSEINIHSLRQKRVDKQEEIAIIVDGCHASAQSFCDSLFVNELQALVISDDLEKKKIFLLCVVESSFLEKRIKETDIESSFPIWRIPFLLPLLEQNFPDQYIELEKKILAQQKQNRWSREDNQFFLEISSYINSGQLLKMVSNGGKAIVDEAEIARLVEKAGTVGKTVLYVATYFPNVTPTEFYRIVESLLEERAIRTVTQMHRLSEKAAKEFVQTSHNMTLMQIWDDDKDRLCKEWLTEMPSPKDSTRIIYFSKPAWREALKKHFEAEHRFYLIDQFNALQKQGILFYPSLRIVESTTSLTIDLMLYYSDEYDMSWLVGMIIELKQKFDAEITGSENLMNQLTRISQGNSLRWTHTRISELISRMLDHSQLKTQVDQCLDFLIKIALHDWAFNIVKQLQFVPEFDDLYWIRQLLNQADNKTRFQAYYYLLAYLKKIDTNIYEVLSKLETWLPEQEREIKNYSPANKLTLRLLIQYCFETIAKFDPKYYGQWPSRYPLFAVKDKAAAKAGFTILTKWLFHPGLKSALISLNLNADPYPLLAALLAEWTFLLFGSERNFNDSPNMQSIRTTETPLLTAQKSETSDSELDPSSLLDLLLEQVSLRVDIFQRAELLEYWNRLERDLLKLINSYLRLDDKQKELKWKRNLVKELAKRFKSFATRAKASAKNY